MSQDQTLAVFEDFKIRRQYDEKAEKWFFSVADIIAALTQQPDHQTAPVRTGKRVPPPLAGGGWGVGEACRERCPVWGLYPPLNPLPSREGRFNSAGST